MMEEGRCIEGGERKRATFGVNRQNRTFVFPDILKQIDKQNGKACGHTKDISNVCY